jgi:hypothetical protein
MTKLGIVVIVIGSALLLILYKNGLMTYDWELWKRQLSINIVIAACVFIALGVIVIWRVIKKNKK